MKMTDGFDTEFFAERFGLRDLTAIVTGAGSGLGRQAARTLAATGAHVALLGRRPEPLQETAELIAQAGGTAQTFPVDVADQEAVRLVLDEIQQSMPPLWVLVNNAGVGGRAALLDVDAKMFDRVFDVNTKAALLVSAAFARRLIEQDLRGRIINICSLAAQTNPQSLGIYGASKAALEHLTRTMPMNGPDTASTSMPSVLATSRPRSTAPCSRRRRARRSSRACLANAWGHRTRSIARC
ncbi:hypothetical protein AWV80_17640 [Cupriavidus sp. UYMU48A]|nr:hypothetical protein AWV80_17640 [Cupriavidus sp. UYMU48A]